MFLYTTLQALACLLLWTALARAGWMPKLQLSLRWRTFAWGLGAGLFSIAVLAVLWAWAGKRGGGLLAPYTAHMALDWILDPIL